MCLTVHQYDKANNKYMKEYDPKKESSYIMYMIVNNLYGWALPRKLPVDGFKCRNNDSTSIKTL